LRHPLDSVHVTRMNTLPDKLLLTAKETAHLPSVTEKTLENWRAANKGPPFIRFTGERRGVRYKVDELKKWIDEQTGAP